MSESGTSGSGRGRGHQPRGHNSGQSGSQPGGQSRSQNPGSGGQGARGGSRRDAQGRERNRGPQRGFTESAPSQRTRRADPARLVAFEVLRAVADEDAYANLVLPSRIRHHGLDKRDAGFATELSYGALRGQGTYDAILARCVDRPLDQLDPAILDALRIGAHQLLAMRVPAHAALDQTVGLARAVIGAGPSALINAVLRKVSARTLDEWLDLLLSTETDATTIASIRYAHPEWIVRALRQSLVAHGRPAAEIDELLEADNAAPVVNLVALPGIGSLDEALEGGATPGELVEGSALSSGGDLGRLASVRDGSTRVQDVGSQLVARAMAAVDLTGKPAGTPPETPAGRPLGTSAAITTSTAAGNRARAPKMRGSAGWICAPAPAARPPCSVLSPGSRAPTCWPTNLPRTVPNWSARPCPPSRGTPGRSGPETAATSAPSSRSPSTASSSTSPAPGWGPCAAARNHAGGARPRTSWILGRCSASCSTPHSTPSSPAALWRT